MFHCLAARPWHNVVSTFFLVQMVTSKLLGGPPVHHDQRLAPPCPRALFTLDTADSWAQDEGEDPSGAGLGWAPGRKLPHWRWWARKEGAILTQQPLVTHPWQHLLWLIPSAFVPISSARPWPFREERLRLRRFPPPASAWPVIGAQYVLQWGSAGTSSGNGRRWVVSRSCEDCFPTPLPERVSGTGLSRP